jgi:hypothetical protein
MAKLNAQGKNAPVRQASVEPRVKNTDLQKTLALSPDQLSALLDEVKKVERRDAAELSAVDGQPPQDGRDFEGPDRAERP